MSHKGRAIAIALLLAVSLPAAAQTEAPGESLTPGTQERDAVTKAFDNFFISLVAARTCGSPDQTTMERFFGNMLAIQQLAVNHYKELLPDKSEPEIIELLNARAEKLDGVVKSSIAAQGCTHPEIVKLVNSFQVNANMDFSKKP